jgi:hypothetical protein
MKTLLTITTLILTMLIVNSCRKNNAALFDGTDCSGNCYILNGKLIDSAINTGISGGELKFYFKNTTGVFSSKTIYLGRAITDGNGDYTFRFDGSRFNNLTGSYYAEAFTGSMFGGDLFYPNRVATFHLDTSFYNLPLIQNFPLFQPATVKVRVVASALTNFQYLTVGYSYGKTGNGIIFNGGRSIDTIITWKTAGDLRTFIEADAVGNGVNIQRRDTLIVPANNTRQIEIRL